MHYFMKQKVSPNIMTSESAMSNFSLYEVESTRHSNPYIENTTVLSDNCVVHHNRCTLLDAYVCYFLY